MTCYEPAPIDIGPTATPDWIQQTQVVTDMVQSGQLDADTARQARAAIARERLRACWLQLEALAEQAATEMEAAQQLQSALISEHRAALDELVAEGELDAPVADLVQTAFGEASFHVWRNNAPITCYIALPPEYEPSADLTGQAAALSKVGDLDPQTLELAQAAIARDMVVLVALNTEGVDSQQQLRLWQDGQLPVDEQALQAARFLAALLAG